MHSHLTSPRRIMILGIDRPIDTVPSLYSQSPVKKCYLLSRTLLFRFRIDAALKKTAQKSGQSVANNIVATRFPG